MESPTQARVALIMIQLLTLAWISTDRESPNAGIAYLILLTQEFGSDHY
jgi:hypothetical protein